MLCGECGAEGQDDWKFCESCGSALSVEVDVEVSMSASDAGASSSSSGESDVSIIPSQVPITAPTDRCRCGAGPESRDDQGFCTACGRLFTPPPPPDNRRHKEIVVADHFATVSDIGKRHKTNQDDVALVADGTGSGSAYVLVVCDGLSSSCAAEAASETAAKTVSAELMKAIHENVSDTQLAMLNALLSAHSAVCAIPFVPDPRRDVPATTVVAALVSGGKITVGWVGDSRAYLLSTENGSLLLSHDHSWVNAMVDAGEMTLEEASASPDAHAITQCLGPTLDDDGSPAPAPEPSVITFDVPSKGDLLLCSDGFWNFKPEPEDIAALVGILDASSPALIVARELVDFANSRGGRDNITAAVLRFGIQAETDQKS